MNTDKPNPFICDTLPGIPVYTCPASCGCNKLVRWTFDNGPLQRFHTYCEGNGNKVHYVNYVNGDNKTLHKAVMLFYKAIAGIVFTDHEALPASYILSYAEKICSDIGEASNGENIIKGMIKMNILKFSAELNGEHYYTHNLPKTIQANYHATNNFRTKGQRD